MLSCDRLCNPPDYHTSNCPYARAKVEAWDGEGVIVTVDGAPVGYEVDKHTAAIVAHWLNEGGLRELENKFDADRVRRYIQNGF